MEMSRETQDFIAEQIIAAHNEGLPLLHRQPRHLLGVELFSSMEARLGDAMSLSFFFFKRLIASRG